MPWKGKPFGWRLPKPYLDFLPEPKDASVNVLRQLTEHLESGGLDEGGEIKITVNYLESPSTQLAIKLQFAAYNSPAQLSLTVKDIPKPDPRKSKARFKLWKYWFKVASPAVPSPSRESVAAVANLACQPYDYAENWGQAKTAAVQFAPEAVKDILAVMVHPPSVRNATPAWVWLPRVQLAAAQIAAQIELAHAIPVRDSLLADVLMGPIDWTIDAAAIALVQRARSESEALGDVRSLLTALVQRIPQDGHWSCAETAFRNWLLLPNVPDDERVQIEGIIASFERE